KARERPHRLQRLWWRTRNFGLRSALTLRQVLANDLLLLLDRPHHAPPVHQAAPFGGASGRTNGIPSAASRASPFASSPALVTMFTSMPWTLFTVSMTTSGNTVCSESPSE